MNKSKFIVNIPLKNFEFHREYCKDCKGFTLFKTSYGIKYFCKICNNVIYRK